MKTVDTSMLCELYGVTREAVSKWRKRGLKFNQLSAHVIIYTLDDVNQFFKDTGNRRWKQY